MQADEFPRRSWPLYVLSLTLGLCCGVASAWLATAPPGTAPVACVAAAPR